MSEITVAEFEDVLRRLLQVSKDDLGRETFPLWRVSCEHCDWRRVHRPDREGAIEVGREHVRRCDSQADEWGFRVVGIDREDEAS